MASGALRSALRAEAYDTSRISGVVDRLPWRCEERRRHERRQHEATSLNGAATLGDEAIDAVTILVGLTTLTVSATTSLNGNSPRHFAWACTPCRRESDLQLLCSAWVQAPPGP